MIPPGAVLTLLAAWALAVPVQARTCDLKTLTQDCKLFEDLNPEDSLEFEDGTSVPACALQSISQSESNRNEAETKPELAKLAVAFSALKPGEVSSATLNRWMNGDLQLRQVLPSETEIVNWPPDSANPTRQSKTPAEVRAYWEQKLGQDGYMNLVDATFSLDQISKKYAARKGQKDTMQFDFSQQDARAERLFKEAKAAVERKILAGRAESALNANEKEILERVRAVTNNKYAYSINGCGIPYHASFDYVAQDISIPPSGMFQPDESILRAMTHEISHAFDLCRLGGGVDGDSAAKKFPRATGDLVHTPFYETYRCLRSDAGGKFRSPKEKSSSPDLKDACYSNHHNEAFCDWFAAETMATELPLRDRVVNGPMPKRVSPKTGKTVKLPNALKAHLMQMDYACGVKAESRYDSTGSHPSWAGRVDNIMLRQPALTQGLNCEPSGKGCPYPVAPRADTPAALPMQSAPGERTQGVD